MLRSTLLVAALLSLGARVAAWEVGPHFNKLNDADVEMATDCLHENYCTRFKIPNRSNIRCRINDVVAYVCNYGGTGPSGKGVGDALNPCDKQEMMAAARKIREEGQKQRPGWKDKYMNGWWFERDWNKAYGFEVPCAKGMRDCETQCGNNWNVRKSKNYFDFDMQCERTAGKGHHNCSLYSITSFWENSGIVLWPWVNDDRNL